MASAAPVGAQRQRRRGSTSWQRTTSGFAAWEESLATLDARRSSTDPPFAPGIDVLDVDGSKGLEFDYVIVADANARAYPDEPESRRRLHVAVTRASHQLWIVSDGRPSDIFRNWTAARVDRGS